MDENTNPINKKTSILLSRNTPVALVVGAAGFLGSHLCDKLLERGLQVLGVDDFTTGRRDYLEEAIKNKDFHLIVDSAQNLDLDLPRLDYLFILTEEGGDVSSLLKVFKETSCRLIFVSTIELYDSKIPPNLRWFKETEAKLAKFAHEHHLNARILRLGPVFGPRMHFRGKDPVTRLIAAALTGDLQKETLVSDFSSRALYVADAVELITKSMLSGSTALKIFDGVLATPIKVAEIKQVLLDPIWYENKGFEPSDLPPWPTPNLEKTLKFLNFKPKVGLVEALKKTVEFFKDHEIEVPQAEKEESKKWQEEKRTDLESIKPKEESTQKQDRVKKLSFPEFKLPLGGIYLLLAVILAFYALIWPVVVGGWGVLTFRYNLTQAAQNLTKGDFDDSLKNVQQAKEGVRQAKAIFDSAESVRKLGLWQKQFVMGDDLLNLATLSADGVEGSILGVKALYQGLRAVTGELNEDAKSYFEEAQIELGHAFDKLSYAQALINDREFSQGLPDFLLPRINSLQQKLTFYDDLVNKGRASALILPEIVAFDGSKSYLILLQNNMELRPAGGFIGSFAKVSFAGGKLKTLEVNDIYAIDGNLKIHVEPPKEIREDLGQKDWYLRDANWEPDFPTSAKQIEWFYTKETGEKVMGVVALDISAMEKLLSAIGPLDLADYNEQITADNLFAKSITYAEEGFFPGSQAKKSFLTALTNQLFNKIFFLPQQNWPGIVMALGWSMEEKHMMVFLDEPKLFSYIVSQNWAGVLPRASLGKQASFQDILAPVEANLGANKANYYLEKRYNLETSIGKEGEVRHRLKISYLNRSPSDAFPAGKYKNRFRIYLPFGTKLVRALWGETDITKKAESFVDFGRSGYSMLLELLPKEQKNLILDYQLADKLSFTDQDNVATYRLNIIKQPGTLKDPLEWKIAYPINYKLISAGSQAIGPQEQVIATDLSKDRSFEVEFKK